jgi:hypothetical protein
MQLRTIWFMLAALSVGSAGGCSSERVRPGPASSGPERGRVVAASVPGEPAPGRAVEPVLAASAPAAAAPAASAAAASAPAAAPVEPAASPSAPVQPAGQEGRDFIDEARMLYRAVACAGEEPVPAHLDAEVVAHHCKLLDARKASYRQRYVTGAKAFLARLRPAGLPDVVVYPFGGGDLISALVAYPDARDITTMSLEHGGDPRRIRDLGSEELVESLRVFRLQIGGMLEVSNNTSENLSAAHLNRLPAQLSSFLVGLAVHDFEPVSVRYFALADDGSLQYLDDAGLQAMEQEQAPQLKHDWQRPNFSTAFSNVEIRFRERGAGEGAPVRVHRHIAANLADAHLAEGGPLLTHLRAKGRVAAMTKAASYLLWRKDFSRIRDYLLGHMDFMLSDSTGIPPMYARRANMMQIPLGRFAASFLGAAERHNQDFVELWAQRPFRRLPFRFGYVDAARQPHLLITKPLPAKARVTKPLAAKPGARPASPQGDGATL